jgi:hypothetical protein
MAIRFDAVKQSVKHPVKQAAIEVFNSAPAPLMDGRRLQGSVRSSPETFRAYHRESMRKRRAAAKLAASPPSDRV